MKVRVGTIALGLATVLAAGGVYLGALRNGFIWDDVIVLDQQLPYFDSLRSMFFPQPGIPQITNYYRPLVFATYRIDEFLASFWPQTAHVQARRITYHAACVVYHGLATLLVFLLGLSLSRAAGRTDGAPDTLGLIGATTAAMLFAVHPIHVESVAWMAGRSDVVCGLFFLTALILYLRYRETGALRLLILAAAAALAAMFAKETGVALVLLIPLADTLLPTKPAVAPATAASSRTPRRPTGTTKGQPTAVPPLLGAPCRWSFFAAALLIYVVVRRTALSSMGAPSLPSGVLDPRTLLGALGWYVAKAVWPPPQSAFVTAVPGGAYALLGLLASSAWVAGTWRWRRSPIRKVERLALTLFFISLAPSVAIALLPVSETPLAERYLYIPSAGLCLAAGFAIARAATTAESTVGKRMVLAACVLLITVSAGWATVQRTALWRNDLVFWSDVVRKTPNESLPHLHLGTAYAEGGDQESAIEQYREALHTARDSEARSKVLNNLGSRYASMGRYVEALDYFKRAVQEAPGYAMAHYNWALAELLLASTTPNGAERLQRQTDGARQLEDALRLNPRYPDAHLEYAHLLLNRGQRKEGIEHLRQVIRLAPSSSLAQVARRSLARVEQQTPH